MTRIMMIHPRPTRGGFSAVVSQAIELLGLGGFEISVMVERGDRLSELPAEVKQVILKHPLKSARGASQARRAITSVRPHLLHLHGRQAGLIGRIVAPRSIEKVLYTPHGTPWAGSSARRLFLTEVSERVLSKRTDSVLCVSRSEQADWVRRDPSSRVEFMPNLIELESNSRTPITPDPQCQLLVPGGYHPQKRLEVVIEALAMTTGSRREVVFCGSVEDDKYREKLIGLARSLGVESQVQFLGNIPDVSSRMRNAELVILPSFSEGFPIVGQEAVAVGANVLWSAIPAHQELFGDTGRSFWTAHELAVLMTRPPLESSVVARQAWLRKFQDDARTRRAAFWRRNAIRLD
ncbi:glycosyltransferase family 4 protein [Aeromicrobium sp. CFBP 8757]|uniref:glycosyltransferase family 4 protein n=1 Tax=Aeromicrobium sp. CFBP 8757 TaxID=2775288 RepID=UPI00177FF4BF|nr:glycosyltransferase family 4 protein [Aeromicrobium sp. CFBP 8757]MBD8608527.1 glycosyltransferase family 4 protein [Aeromicrobium sp. CFBP 8757]